MRRYLIPFAVGIMLGVGAMPLWAGSSELAAAPGVSVRNTSLVLPADTPIKIMRD